MLSVFAELKSYIKFLIDIFLNVVLKYSKKQEDNSKIAVRVEPMQHN